VEAYSNSVSDGATNRLGAGSKSCVEPSVAKVAGASAAEGGDNVRSPGARLEGMVMLSPRADY
jgi:hypothetical protein